MSAVQRAPATDQRTLDDEFEASILDTIVGRKIDALTVGIATSAFLQQVSDRHRVTNGGGQEPQWMDLGNCRIHGALKDSR